MAVRKSLISLVSIVIIVGAGAVWSGVGTLAVALQALLAVRAVRKSLISLVSIVIIVGAGAVWSGVGTLAVALVIYHSLSTVPD
jgi:hypothetical protein